MKHVNVNEACECSTPDIHQKKGLLCYM